MAGAVIARSFLSNNPSSSFFSLFSSRMLRFSASRLRPFQSLLPPQPGLLSPAHTIMTSPTPSTNETKKTISLSSTPSSHSSLFIPRRLFSSSEQANDTNRKPSSKLTNFSLSDSESDSDEDDDDNKNNTKEKPIDKSKLPPPYDPFNKKPAIEEPKDPNNLQEVFHNMRSDGLMQNAVKMFDALSKDGLTHEALQLFAEIKDKGSMPDVIAHTSVIEAYANAGQGNEALKVYMRMLASGVQPNAYTYSVLIRGLVADGKQKLLGDAKKYLVEMMDKGMRPNAGTYTAVFEALVRVQQDDQARELLEEMKDRGFVPAEKAVREALHNTSGPLLRTVINILFGK